MKTRMISMICGLAFFMPLVAFSQNKLQGTVTGNDGPLYYAKVEVLSTNLKTRTDEAGTFKFTNLPNGVYSISVDFEGYENYQQLVTLDAANSSADLKIKLVPDAQLIQEVQVTAIIADDKTPTTYQNLSKEDLEKENYGQDLPYMLRFTPSAVVTSDAGAGVGYTGLRIRGVDPTRTNVTVNGVPLNDAESHGVFWVNMPDFTSSVDEIQVQRGVGTSANGSTAFGASINVNTNKVNRKAYGVLDNSVGSFGTLRNTVSAGTGLINNKFTVDTRLSSIKSDGYIDRASADLKSFYVSGAWLGKKSSLRANIFSGKEVTYQAWYGTPESVINGNEAEIIAYADRNYIFGEDRENLLNSGRTYNYYTYENEVDNYKQDHYQLLFNHRFNHKLALQLTGHYTRGAGYYEQYRADDDFDTYGFDPLIISTDTITTTDLIRRRWLDNHFYGGIFTLNYKHKALELNFGGGGNQYTGAHYGEVIWAEFASNSEIRDRYYDNDGIKTEFHSYVKGKYKYRKFTFYGDVQVRMIDYSFLGIDDVSGSLEEVTQDVNYTFLNPKAGLMYDFNSKNNLYASVAIANREPVRRDFRESTPENRPVPEQLMDFEAGYRYKGVRLFTNVNGYFMNYKNQLILTGQINDVGGYTRTNVEDSYRAGIEIEAGYNILRNLSISGNIALSQNKVIAFNEFIDNYDIGGQDTIAHSNTDLAFSPNIIAAAGIGYEPVKGLEINLVGKYVGDQYLDNTSTATRKLDAYFFSNLNIRYTIKTKVFSEIILGAQINNLFDALYENNGYTWGYIYGGERTVENFYYPQAGRNYMARVTLKF